MSQKLHPKLVLQQDKNHHVTFSQYTIPTNYGTVLLLGLLLLLLTRKIYLNCVQVTFPGSHRQYWWGKRVLNRSKMLAMCTKIIFHTRQWVWKHNKYRMQRQFSRMRMGVQFQNMYSGLNIDFCPTDFWNLHSIWVLDNSKKVTDRLAFKCASSSVWK